MHFGRIVKNAAYSAGHSAKEFAYMLGITETELLKLYEQKEWLSGNIKLASQVLEHDFGKHFNNGVQFDFRSADMNENTEEINLTIRYPKGKEFLLKTWLHKMALIAKAIGLQTGN
ncbi:MAG TPA: hypothetical protein VLZ28_08510 [Daejeonella sp.]|nr:hypothetical protein [Daejeonella sp.]